MSYQRPPSGGGRVDANQPQIVRELRALGFRVDIVSQLKKLYDLVVTGRRGGRSGLYRPCRDQNAGRRSDR